MKINKLVVKIFLFFSLIFLQNAFLFSQSVLDKKFSNYFSKEYFVNFPNWKIGFDFKQIKIVKVDDEILSLENSDDLDNKKAILKKKYIRLINM